MKLITRMTKLFTADAHAVLDSIEDPHALLKQALRDMESSIDDKKQALENLVNHKKKLTHQLQLLDEQYAEVDKDLDVCFESENEALARSIVKKKLFIHQRIEQAKVNLHQTTEEQSELEKQLLNEQEQYSLIEQQAEVYLATQKNVTEQSTNPSGSIVVGLSDDDIEMAFINEKRKRATS